MFGIIKDVLNLPQKAFETADDLFFGSYITGERRIEEARVHFNKLVDDGYSKKDALQMTIDKFQRI